MLVANTVANSTNLFLELLIPVIAFLWNRTLQYATEVLAWRIHPAPLGTKRGGNTDARE